MRSWELGASSACGDEAQPVWARPDDGRSVREWPGVVRTVCVSCSDLASGCLRRPRHVFSMACSVGACTRGGSLTPANPLVALIPGAGALSRTKPWA